MQKETYHENQQIEIFKIKDEQNILWKKGPPYCATCVVLLVLTKAWLFIEAFRSLMIPQQAIFSWPNSFLQKSSWRVSSKKNILNSSVESCCVVWCGVVLRKVYFPTHILFIINAYTELSHLHSHTLLDFPKYVYYQ